MNEIEFKDLLDKKQYDEIIEKTKDSLEVKDILFCVESYRYKGEIEKAIYHFKKNREIVEKDNVPKAAIEILSLMCLNKSSDADLEKEADYYKNLPYVNQETEEFLRKIDDFIISIKEVRDDIGGAIQDLSIKDIKTTIMESHDASEIFRVFNLIKSETYKGLNIDDWCYDSLNNRETFDVCYGLILEHLIFSKYGREVFFKKEDKYYKIIPSELYQRHNSFIDLLARSTHDIEANEKNVSVGTLANSIIYLSYLFFIPNYPHDDEVNSIIVAALELALEQYNENPGQDKYYKSLVYNTKKKDEFKTLFSQIIFKDAQSI